MIVKVKAKEDRLFDTTPNKTGKTLIECMIATFGKITGSPQVIRENDDGEAIAVIIKETDILDEVLEEDEEIIFA